MRILRENLRQALKTTIDVHSEEEKGRGYKNDSCFVAGLKAVLEAIENDEPITVS